MRRTRVLMMGIMVALMILAGRGQARADLQTCIDLCYRAEQLCKLNCDGNTTCINTCETNYNTCVFDGCDRE